MLLSVVSNFDNSNATFIVDSSSNELAKDGNKESLPSSVTYYVYRTVKTSNSKWWWHVPKHLSSDDINYNLRLDLPK